MGVLAGITWLRNLISCVGTLRGNCVTYNIRVKISKLINFKIIPNDITLWNCFETGLELVTVTTAYFVDEKSPLICTTLGHALRD